MKNQCIAALISVLLLATIANGQTTSTWMGPAGGSYNDPAHWSSLDVPVNNGGDTYDVVIPSGSSVQFDVPGGPQSISSLDLNLADLTVGNSFALEVLGSAAINGRVDVDGGSFVAASSSSDLTSGDARLSVSNGMLTVSGLDFVTTRRTHEEILAARNNSTLDVSSLQTLEFGPVSGRFTKSILASNSTIDLSSLTSVSITPGEDDLLDFRYEAGGDILLPQLTNLNSNGGNGNERVRFFFEQSRTFDFPMLSNARRTEFRLPTNSTVNLPQLTSLSGSGTYLEIADGATWNAPHANFTSLADAVILLNGTATLNAPQVSDISNVGLTIGPSASFQTSNLTAIDNARLLLDGNFVFDQVHATTYLNTRRANEEVFLGPQ